MSNANDCLAFYVQGDHFPDTVKLPDISPTGRGTRARVKCYS